MLRAGVLREAEEQLFVAAARAAAVHEVEHELRQAEARVRTRGSGVRTRGLLAQGRRANDDDASWCAQR